MHCLIRWVCSRGFAIQLQTEADQPACLCRGQPRSAISILSLRRRGGTARRMELWARRTDEPENGGRFTIGIQQDAFFQMLSKH